MKWMQVMLVAALLVVTAQGAALAYGDDDMGTAPGYVKRSAMEEKAIQSSAAGVNVRGESGGFDDYLNDDLFPGEDEFRLMDVDADSRLVLGGGEDAPGGVSFKKSYERSPIAE
ncbi:MAG: hypothetical protein KBD07_02170 [Candidatus Omnitrophica bacterium]|jgi:hypothetical protein|nr:hypothetical protein [Candidatus Omnitrophota bacterium]